MENKTAMQLFLDYLHNQQKLFLDRKSNFGMYVPKEFFAKATELLTTEKEQIKDAFNQGYRDGELDGLSKPVDPTDISEFVNAEEYFNQTYKP